MAGDHRHIMYVQPQSHRPRDLSETPYNNLWSQPVGEWLRAVARWNGHIEEIICPQSKGCAQSEAQPYWFVFHIFKFQYSLVCVCESSRWILYIPSTAFWQRTRRLQGAFLCSTLFVTNFIRHQLLQTELEKRVFHHSVLAISLTSFTLVYMSKRRWTRYWTLSPFTI